jgi:peptidyl-prolyl cis-trans isomerase B (cyclophilin B)
VASSKTRQRKLARAKLERQQARRSVKARRNRQIQAGLAAGLVVVVAVVVGLWIGGVFSPSKKPKIAASTCQWNAPPNTQALTDVGRPPTSGMPTSGAETMTITTNQGTVAVNLDLANAPCTAANFSYLAGKNFFNNTKCSRLTTSGTYTLQCGDPKGDGTGGPAYIFANENVPTGPPASASPSAAANPSASGSASASAAASADPSASASASQVIYPRGTVAMFNNAPDTNGSQFFIVYKDTAFNPQYSVVGTVASGMDVVDKIAAAGAVDSNGAVTTDGTPKTDVTIQTLTVDKAASATPTPATTASPSAGASAVASASASSSAAGQS